MAYLSELNSKTPRFKKAPPIGGVSTFTFIKCTCYTPLLEFNPVLREHGQRIKTACLRLVLSKCYFLFVACSSVFGGATGPINKGKGQNSVTRNFGREWRCLED